MAKKRKQKTEGRGRVESTPRAKLEAARVSRATHPAANILLALFAFGLYANTLSHGYVLDDAAVIANNRFTQAGLAGVADHLTTDSFHGFSTAAVNDVAGGRYRPLSLVTFAIEHEIFGPNPRVSHAGNVLLYAACVVGLYWVLTLLLPGTPGRPWFYSAPFVTSLIFAAHPVHTEVVANIKGRDELLALLGSLTCLGLIIRSLDSKGVREQVAAGVVFFLALLSKENSITFLAIIPLSICFFRGEKLIAPRRWLPPLLISSLLFLWIRQLVVVDASVTPELLNDPFLGTSAPDRFATVFYTLGLYLKLLVYPHPLSYDYYPFHIPILSWSDGRAWLGLGLYAALAGAALAGFRRRWVISYGILFYLLALSIASNLVFSIGTFMSERFIFMPSVGACLIAGWLFAQGLERLESRPILQVAAVRAALALVLLIFATLTVARNRVWQDNFTLFTTDVKTSSNSALGNCAAAEQFLIAAREETDPSQRAKWIGRARIHLERAIEIHPKYARALSILAAVHKDFLGDVDRALEYYERIFEFNPDEGYVAYNLGSLILAHRRHRLDDAIRYLTVAIEGDPQDADAFRNLAIAYLYHGAPRRSVALLERAVALRPNDKSVNLNLAQVFYGLGDTEQFIYYRNQAERLGATFEPLDDVEFPSARRTDAGE